MMLQGEYVAPERVENILNRSHLVAQAFVYGDSLRSSLVGVVVPEPDNAKKWAASKGVRDVTRRGATQLQAGRR